MTQGSGGAGMGPEIVHVRRRNVVGAWIRDEYVLLCLERDLYFALDEIGARLWDLLEEGRSAAELCRALGAEYDATEAEIADAVHRMLRHLADRQLIAEETAQP